jgi:RHS repeat-associated protein
MKQTLVRRVAAGLAVLMACTLTPEVPAWATEPDRPEQHVQDVFSVPGSPAKSRTTKPAPVKQFTPPKPVWPAAASAVVDLGASAAARTTAAGRMAKAGMLPVSVAAATGSASTGRTAAAPPGKVRVEMLDRAKAQSSGAALAVRLSAADGAPAAGSVRVRIDHTAVASAYGAGWADRARLVRLDCDPAGACRAEPLPTAKDASGVSAEVQLASSGTVVAMAAGATGNSGDFAATSMSPSSTWSHGGSSGGFAWSYDVRTPPSLGGPQPKIGLSYSSQSTDGRTVSTNNQASWFGEGFDWAPGYIERRYTSCSEDMSGENNNTTKVWDQCWKTDNATMLLNGRSAELIYNSAEKRWHSRSEDGAHIERKIGAVNGDDGEAGADGDKGEHWIVTTSDGTKYHFGLNRLQGWTTDKAETNSVLTAPVYGNHPNEPCRKTAFADSSCTQAYRWSLDYVVDPHGNTMSYWYGKDTSKYGRNKSETDLATYDRDGYLKRVEYGTHQRDKVAGVATDTVFTATKAPMQVVFTPADRCVTNCTDKANWQDTPADLECATGKKCLNWSPTFWSNRRLQSITTKVWNAAAGDYRDVERWTLTHSFPDNGDGTPGSLWLSEIAHEGLLGARTTVPNIVFTPVAMDNRVDTALQNGLRPMRRPRIDTIVTETGGKIDVNYRPAECVAGSLPTPETNTKLCYPVRWAPEDLGQEAGKEITDWFHKYVVDNVMENDATSRPTGSPLATVTKYEYLEGAAWRYSELDAFTKANRRTWNQFRGYGVVRTTIGEAGEQSVSETRYFQGMHGDRLNKDGGAKVVRITDSKNQAELDDLDEFAGMRREEITYNGLGSPISGALDVPWMSAPTASRTTGTQTIHARFVSVGETRTWTALDGGRPDRWTRTQHEFDAHGAPARTTDHGDIARTGDERCTLTDYARNTTRWLTSYPSRVRQIALTCTEATRTGRVLTEQDVIGDVRTSFDGEDWGVAPLQGEPSRIEELKSWANNTPQYLETKTMAYDDYGRITDMWDVADRHTGTAYTPQAGGPVTKVVVTNPALWTDTTEVDPMGNATTVIDANKRTTTKKYDGLGRLTHVWLPGRSLSATPNYEHTYGINNTEASWVESKTLNPAGAQTTTIEFYDALLRVRQRQYTSATAGRVVSDTFYDSAGRAYLTWGPYHETTKPVERAVWVPADGHDRIDMWNRTFFDGAGRAIEQVQYSRLTETWRTSMRYTGDRTTVIPPRGGTATATVVDAGGNTIERRQYHDRDLTGGYDRTTYEYDRKGKQTAVRVKATETAETVWTFGYDLRGRQTSADDPDKGSTTTTFDDEGRVTMVTDAEQRSLTYAYSDPLGRRTGLFDGTEATPAKQLVAWGYDEVLDTTGNSISLGVETSSTRYAGGATGAAYKKAVTALDSAGRPTKNTITIPSTETGLAGTYEYQTSYKANGSTATTRMPAIGGTGGLGVETLTNGYQHTGLPTTLATTLGSSYVVSTDYTAFGEVGLMSLRNASGRVTQIGNYYEEKTRRLNRIWTTREVNPASVSDVYFGYDEAGNVTSAAESSATAGAERQCFRYDHLARLTEAWTPNATDCAADPAVANLTGPAPYWTSWRFDAAGNRDTQIEHRTPAGERTTKYTYPAPSADLPHALSSIAVTDTNGTKTSAYEYDDNGNTLSRPAAAGTQSLEWNTEGKLIKSTDSTGITTYLYDGSGNRLIRKDPGGSTLYLPGQELRVNASGQRQSCTRYYQHAGRTVAMRTLTGVTWLSGDHQGTAKVAIEAASQAFSLRRQDPYGNARGAATGTAWPAAMDKGLVGGTLDNSGLTHLGARQYDPVIGRFVSADPILDFNDPVQMHGYGYANHSPVTSSDPSGLKPLGANDEELPNPTGAQYSGRTKHGHYRNPYTSDAGERRGTADPAETSRIRQVRKRQIMEGQFGIRDQLKEELDLDSSKRLGGGRGRGSAAYNGVNEFVENWTEDQLVEHLIDKYLARIDEGRHAPQIPRPGKEIVAFKDDEFILAFKLAKQGRMVESRNEKLQVVGAHSEDDGAAFDAYVDDVRSEFKSPTSNNEDRHRKIISHANEQHATRLYMDVGDRVEAETVEKAMQHFLRNSGDREYHYLTEIQVMGGFEAPLQKISPKLRCEGTFFGGC